MENRKELIRFNKITRYCRWQFKYPPDDWTIFGLAMKWISPTDFYYKLCFFGFDVFIHFKRIFK